MSSAAADHPRTKRASAAMADPAKTTKGRPGRPRKVPLEGADAKDAAPKKSTRATTAKSAETKAKTTRKTGEKKTVDEAVKTTRTRARKGPQKILFTVSEVAPFVSTGGMGQVVSSLPTSLHRNSKDVDVRVIAPYYQQIRSQFGAGMKYIGNLQVPLSWRSKYCGVFQAERDGVIYYFIDNEDYFNRPKCYDYFDDGERFAFFSKAVLSVLEMIDFVPDVVHAHDWQTALIPIYLKTTFAHKYPDMRSVYTIHNIEYQGKFLLSALWDVLDLRPEDYGIVEYKSFINLVKGAIVCADRVTTVSPSYVEEIKIDGGYGLEPILSMNSAKLLGIINGIDVDLYNPATDRTLANTFTEDSLADKAANKRDLQSLFGLPVSPKTPVLCMISRLVSHKGLDLLITIMEELISDDVQFLLLGTGDHNYELFFNEMSIRYPDKVAVNIAYNPEIGNKIYGGADIMLMPSLSEPCGLSQMIACRYATIPVVRATGGLKDTIRDCRNGDGNGFLFQNYDAGEFLSTIRQAIHLYTFYEDDWHNLMKEAMRSDFRWDLSAKAYAAMYATLR